MFRIFPQNQEKKTVLFRVLISTVSFFLSSKKNSKIGKEKKVNACEMHIILSGRAVPTRAHHRAANDDDDDEEEDEEEEDKEWTWTECSTRTMGRKKFSTI